MINTEMNKDEDKIVLWNEKNRTKMIAFLTSIIAGFLTYLFLMTNLMSNSDAIMLYSDGTKFDLHAALGGAATGRWLLAIVEELVSPYKSPLLIGTIDIILTALTSYLCVDILKIKKDINAIILGLILISFPSVMSYISFSSIAFPVSVLMAVTSVWVLQRKANGSRYAWIILGLSLAIYPTNISCALVLMVYTLLVELSLECGKEFLKKIREYLVTVLAAGLFLIVSSKMIMHFFSVPSTAYQGADEALSGGFLTHLFSNLSMILVKAYRIGYRVAAIYPSLKWALIIVYAAQIIMLIMLFIKKRLYRSIWKSLCYLALIVLIPLSLCTMTVISSTFDYNLQHRAMWPIMLASSLMLAESLRTYLKDQANNGNLKRLKRLKGVSVAWHLVLLLMVYGFVLYDHSCIMNEKYVMEHDRTLMVRVLTALDNEKGFDYSKPVYFYVMQSDDPDMVKRQNSLFRDDQKFNSIAFPDSTTNFWDLCDAACKNHMYVYEGVRLNNDVSDDMKKRIKEDKSLWEKYKSFNPWDFDVFEYDDTGVYVVAIKSAIAPFYMTER